MNKRISIIIVFLILFFFIIVVRTAGLLNNNNLFLFDSARDFLFVKKIVIDHKLILIGPASGGLQGYFQGVIWYYMLSIPFALSGGNPISGTWFMAVMSSLSVLAAFFILKRIMNIYAGILGVLFLGFSEYSIATTKFIWNPYPIVWIMPFYFFGIYLISRQSKWGILIVSLASGLILHFEVIYGLGILPAYLIMLVFYFRQKSVNIARLKNIFIVILLFLFPMIPSAIFDLRHQFLISKSIIKTAQTGGVNITHKEDETPNNISNRLRLRFDDLVKYSAGSMTENTYINYGLFGFFIVGIFLTAKTKKNKRNLIIFSLAIGVILSPFFVFLLLKYNVWGYYWIGNAPLYALTLAFVIGYVAEEHRLLLPFIILSVLLFVIAKPWNVLNYWYKGNLESGPQVLSTQLNVIKAVYKDAGGKPFSVYEQTPPVYDYVYRYLFWWEGSRVYNYIPNDQKQKITYVVLEGVPEDPNAVFFEKQTLHLTTESEKTFSFGNKLPTVKKFTTDPKEKPVDSNFFPQL